MPTTIPLTNSPEQTFRVELLGQLHSFRVTYNTRSKTWHMNITDVNNVLLLSGVALVLGTDLLKQYNLGLGSMYMIDTGENGNVDAGPYDLGTRVLLQYEVPQA